MREKDRDTIISLLNRITDDDRQIYEEHEKLSKINKENFEEFKKINNLYNDVKFINSDLNGQILNLKRQNQEKEYEILAQNNNIKKIAEKLQITTQEKQIIANNYINLETSYKKLELDFDKLKTKLASLKAEKDESDNDYKELRNERDDIIRERDKLREQLRQSEKMTVRNEPVRAPYVQKSNSSNAMLSAFNSWAARPSAILPNNFFYAEGNFKIRTKQDINETREPTEWIIYKSSGIRYLFPNPIFFNDRTDISYLYQGEMNFLKPRDNRIQILEPCEISETGFIEFPGKFKLL
jgi:DNA repair exonuclease SbcCD ATPase subunit